MGKGDKNRITDQVKFNKEFDRIFRSKPSQKKPSQKKPSQKKPSQNKTRNEEPLTESTVNSDWNVFMCSVNEIRRKYNLPDKVFKPGEYKEFINYWIKNK